MQGSFRFPEFYLESRCKSLKRLRDTILPLETWDYSTCSVCDIRYRQAWYYAYMLLWDFVRSAIRGIKFLLWIGILLISLPGSTPALRDPAESIRQYTRGVEFEFVGWTLESLWGKLGQFSLSVTSHMSEGNRRAVVLEYFQDLKEVQALERRAVEIIGDPNQNPGAGEYEQLQAQLDEMESFLATQKPLVEAILEQQASQVIGSLGIGVGGRIFPPLSFEFTQLPLSLIVSPRDVIVQEANIPLVATLTLEDKISLEGQVDEGFDVSSLVVNVGGVGTYPTMVLESSSLPWVVETVIHEWVHNYLTLRPLGLNYLTSHELRTMNETTASILGKEIARDMLSRYYPEFVPPPETSNPETPSEEPPAFDFRAEMHEIRVTADDLLAQGKIEEAEDYMEERRQFLWEKGYRIRKLNQAYFAFHGAYADEPGGASGEDPVGAAVRELWDRISDPAEFLWTMSWMNDFSDLEQVLEESVTTP